VPIPRLCQQQRKPNNRIYKRTRQGIASSGSCFFALFKSSRIGAAAAQVLFGSARSEAVNYFSRAWGIYNFIDVACKNISEGYYPVAVKAAGNDRSVAEYSEVVAKTIAETIFRFERRILVWPDEAVSPFKV
jgi:hypothetical protein